MLRLHATAISVFAVSAVLAAGCSAPGAGDENTGNDSGPIKIALVDAQSGQLSALGAWELKGARLAVDEWNAAGGVNGRQIQLDVFDDQGDPTVGTNLARKIDSEGYIAMIGTAESAVTIAMAPILKQAEIPNITSGQSPGLVAVGSEFLFLNGPTSTTYDETLAKHVVDTKGIKSIAMITNNGSYGKGEHDAFLKALTARGVTPVADQVVTTDQKDFSAVLTGIRQKNPQLIFLGAEEVESGLIVKQARDLGITAPFAGAAPQGTPVFLDTAGAANVEGTIVSSPYLSNDIDDASKKFAAAYQAKFNEEAEMHGAKAYDGTQILLTALKTSNLATGKALADAIRATKHDGLLGDFAYDRTGVGIFATSIGTIQNGKLVAAS
ncbi:branched-chain amino acid ABC transporter substrate-binding protein [Actinoplanes lobatus]|uniref:Branched-chain amino acid ABC transporter substrate-binding protein n=1 Tax=Actinoplanes lobatus TaxID=113568 RepID=A0A7W7MJ72_9ACTN|nr:ABC transporter substrate-binding protein [Actinoplanes lobatus]MBB4752269.1 branched-chain amino acid transport system substrate-binding protein [Actinoplanes lobatus]GGN94116.1 branched-chain amino acid ABC transporter substrate-binding protein [Actinoplanes lobatus]GIE45746.1 branched-chain amino acid ABC transporter substrate-binding protein [Actinoplanes lobatus]